MGSGRAKLDEMRQISAFSRMTLEELEHLEKVLIRREYNPGQFIFLEGDPSGGVWFIANGRVRIIRQSLNGRLQGLCLVDRGKCFGGCPLFDGSTNPANAQALDDVTLYVLPHQQLNRLVQENPQLASLLLQIFSKRLSHLARLGEGLSAWTTSNRINDCILSYAADSNPFPVVSLTHEKLASLAGTVREVVTRHLSQLEKKGVIRLEPGQIIILDLEALNACCLSAS